MFSTPQNNLQQWKLQLKIGKWSICWSKLKLTGLSPAGERLFKFPSINNRHYSVLHTLWGIKRNNKDKVASGWEQWYINYIEENKSTYSYNVCQKFARLLVGSFLANRIVFVVTGHIPKADASINRAVHAVLVQTPIWLGLPPHKVSNWTKRVHPEPVTLPVNAIVCANNICQ